MSSIEDRGGPGIWASISRALESAKESFFGKASPEEARVDRVAQRALSKDDDLGGFVEVSYEECGLSAGGAAAAAAVAASAEEAEVQEPGSEVQRSVIPSPDDGGCLYHSVIHYLTFQGGYAPFEAELRELTAGLMAAKVARGPDQDIELIGHLENAIIEHNESIERRFSEAKANLTAIASMEGVDPAQAAQAAHELERLQGEYERDKIAPKDYSAYIAKVKTPGFFAAGAEIHLIAKEYNVPINIYVPGNAPDSYRKLPISFNNAASGDPIELLYTPQKRHYDLLIK